MASIQRRTRKDGTHSYRVAYRDNRRQRTRTFPTLAEAEGFAAVVESPVGRRLEVTALQVESWDVTRSGGSASVRVTWTWTR